MANEQITNVVSLRREADFNDWISAACVYQAHQVLIEADTVADHALRARLANDVILDPTVIAKRMVNIIATDSQVYNLGGTAVAVGQTLVLSKTAEYWTPMAKLVFGAA